MIPPSLKKIGVELINPITFGLILVFAWLSRDWVKFIPPSLNLLLVYVLSALILLFSFKKNSPRLAAWTMAGATLAPILAGWKPTQLNTPIFLLGLLLILPLFATRRWSIFNLVTLVGITITYLIWFGTYTPDQVNPEPFNSFIFSAGYFGIGLLTALLTHFRRPAKSRISELIFLVAVPSLFFLAAYYLFFDLFQGCFNFFTLDLSLVYLGLWFWAKKINPQDRYLRNSFGGIALLLATLAIPLTFSNQISLWLWLLEASLIFVLTYQVKKYRRGH